MANLALIPLLPGTPPLTHPGWEGLSGQRAGNEWGEGSLPEATLTQTGPTPTPPPP